MTFGASLLLDPLRCRSKELSMYTPTRVYAQSHKYVSVHPSVSLLSET